MGFHLCSNPGYIFPEWVDAEAESEDLVFFKTSTEARVSCSWHLSGPSLAEGHSLQQCTSFIGVCPKHVKTSCSTMITSFTTTSFSCSSNLPRLSRTVIKLAFLIIVLILFGSFYQKKLA